MKHAAAAMAIAALFAAGSVTSAGATSSDAENGRLAFARIRDTNTDIYSIYPDGTHLRRLTRLPTSADALPAWSPDGEWIAFWSTRSDRGGDIWVIRKDGSDPRQVTSGPARDHNPDWSPDARRIVFDRVDEDYGNEDVFVVNRDGSGLTPLTDAPTTDSHPAWSPDGSEIAFASDPDGVLSIYVMRADGTGVRRLTSSFDSDPDWSPDGRWIAFNRIEGQDLWVVAADGSQERAVVAGRRHDTEPEWSPDGRFIAFVRMTRDGYRLLVTNAGGGGTRTIDEAGDISPGVSWQPR